MFETFNKKPISNVKKSTEVLIAIDVEKKTDVDNMVKKAVVAGGKMYMEAQDHGWVNQHSFRDLYGHQWEVFYVDLSKLPKQ